MKLLGTSRPNLNSIFLSIFMTIVLMSCSKSGSGTAPSSETPVVVPPVVAPVLPAPSLLALSPSTFFTSVNHQVQLIASGGATPYVFSVLSGAGNIDSSTGLFTASTSAGGVIVRVTDSAGATADSNLTVNSVLAINPTSISLVVNANTIFSASGGVAPYTYSIVSGGGSVDATTGAFVAPAAAGATVVRVSDVLGDSADANVNSLDVLTLNATRTILAVTNLSTLSALGGVAPYTYSIVSGGGSVNATTGAFTVPAMAGVVGARVTDSLGATADLSLTVNAALAITPSSISLATNATTTFSASGGVSPYSYSIVSGGGSVNAVSGLFTAPAVAATVVVRVTDSLSNTSQATVSMNSAPTITSISDRTVYEGRPAVINFVLADNDGALSCTNTNLSATSVNTTLLPVSNIVFAGVYPNCTATLSLAAAQAGTSQVSIVVSDSLATSSATFVVTGHKINSVVLAPLTPIVPKNSNFSFSLTATYSDASTRNITANTTWATSNTGISSFTSAGVLNNTYAGTTVATSTITATYGAFTANTVATINPATITSLIVDISSATMNVGGSLQLKCYGLTSDGGSLDLTESCSWSSGNPLIVAVDNYLDKGSVSAISLGSATNVTATYAAFSANSSIQVDVTPPVISDDGIGLTAKYFTGTAFNTLTNTRIDANVNFNWAAGNNPAGSANSFSVRWTGFIKAPSTGTFTFYTQSDDGTRLWVDGVQVVNNWTDHSSAENTGTISLVAGQKYPITLEFYENGGDAVMQLRYSGPGVVKQVIPQINLFPY
jgi:hypothetical protein